MNQSIIAPVNPYLERLSRAWPSLPLWYKAKVFMVVLFLGTYGLLKKRLAEKMTAVRTMSKRSLYQMAKQWISKFAFSFVKVPKEKESEFYAALKYFAVKILQYQDEEKAPLPPSPELPSGTENK